MSILLIYLLMKHPDKTAQIVQNKWFRYGGRVLTLYLFSVIFKSFDASFPHDWGHFGLRGQFFSWVYVLFGLLVWEGAARIAGKMYEQPPPRRPADFLRHPVTMLTLYGALAALLFSFLYSSADRVMFGKISTGENLFTRPFGALQHTLPAGTFFSYLMILSGKAVLFYRGKWQDSLRAADKQENPHVLVPPPAPSTPSFPSAPGKGPTENPPEGPAEAYFFSSSLRVLAHLVYRSQDVAAEYTRHLAKCFRYLEAERTELLVPLEAELSFLASYGYLLEMRHPRGIDIDIAVRPALKRFSRVPPGILRDLVEGVIQHTLFSADSPLRIVIGIERDRLTVAASGGSERPARLPGSDSTAPVPEKCRLHAVRERYRIISGESIEVVEKNDGLLIRVPLF